MRKVRISIIGLLIAGFGFSATLQASVPKSIYLAKNPNVEKAMDSLFAGELKIAQKYFKKAARANLSHEKQLMVLNNLCAVSYNLGEHKEALKACNKALRLDKRDWKSYVNRANAYAALNQKRKAENDYKQALKINPTSSLAAEAYNIFKTIN